VGSPEEEFEDFDDVEVASVDAGAADIDLTELELSDLEDAGLDLDPLELDDLELDVRHLLAQQAPPDETATQAAHDALRLVAGTYPLLPLTHDVTETRGPHATDVRSLLFRGHGIVVELTLTVTGDRCDLVGRVRPRHRCTAAVLTTDVRIDLPDRGDNSFHGRRLPRRPSTLVLQISDGDVPRHYRTEWTRF
jgi:hypothetical protein